MRREVVTSPEEDALLDRYNISWSKFCHQKIMELKGIDKDELFEKIVLRAILIAVGGLIFALSPLLNDIVLVVVEYVIGTTMILTGSISMIFLWKRQRGVTADE